MAQLVGWHLQTTLGPVPSGQEDSQLAARCEDRHPPEKAVAAQKKTDSGGENDADPKTIVSHRVSKRDCASRRGTGHTARREEDVKNKTKVPRCRQDTM